MGKSKKEEKRPPKPKGKGFVSEVDKAVLDLKNSRDKLSRYPKQLDKDSEKLLQRAKECNANGNRNMAIGLLRLRRLKEKEVAKVEDQLLNVLEIVDTIVGKEKEIDLVNAMTAGKEAMVQLHEKISVDEVLELMDKVQEEVEVERQINEAIDQGVVSLTDADKMDVEHELKELENSMKDVSNLPEAPDKPLPESKVSPKTEDLLSQPDKAMVPA